MIMLVWKKSTTFPFTFTFTFTYHKDQFSVTIELNWIEQASFNYQRVYYFL